MGSALVNGIEIVARTRVSIGANCRIGARCVILDADFHDLNPEKRSMVGKTAPVVIGKNVWLGVGVMVLKGVSIGNDAVVGAGCVVAKNIPAGGIAVGNPMIIIGTVYDQ